MNTKAYIQMTQKFFYYYTIILGAQTLKFQAMFSALDDIFILPPPPPCETTLWRNLIFLPEPKIQNFWIFGQFPANKLTWPSKTGVSGT